MRHSRRANSDRTIDGFLSGYGSGEERLDVFFDALAGAPQGDESRIDTLAATIITEVEPVGPIPSGSNGRARQGHPLPLRWRRRAMFSTLLSSLVAKIAFAGVAMAATTGGLAATGTLPDAAQQAVSDVASRIGISIPAPGDDDAEVTDLGEAPELPEEAADTAKSVIDTVFGGDPSTGADFGGDVADSAGGEADVPDVNELIPGDGSTGSDNAGTRGSRP